MILGALIALGVDGGELIEKLHLLDIADFEIEISTKDKSGISAAHVKVKTPEENTHRHLHTIEKIINNSRLSDSVKKRAVEIFTRLAEAEAKVHGIETRKVHFHEVGAMDAIVDVVGACVGFEMLAIDRFVCSKIHVGSGFVNMAHGKFPVPPPAVAELLKGFPIYSTEITGELITPTGAAIISTVCDESGVLPEMTIEKTAYGAGTRDYDGFPNVLRLIVGEQEKRRKRAEELVLIETNLDDISPEVLGFVMEKAFEDGALDCWFTAIQMKKNRPAVMISILCNTEKKENLIALLYNETSTLGVRVATVERNCLEREIQKFETEFGTVDVKIAKREGKIVNAKPEFEQIREIALRENIAFTKLKRTIEEKFFKSFEKE